MYHMRVMQVTPLRQVYRPHWDYCTNHLYWVKLGIRWANIYVVSKLVFDGLPICIYWVKLGIWWAAKCCIYLEPHYAYFIGASFFQLSISFLMLQNIEQKIVGWRRFVSFSKMKVLECNISFYTIIFISTCVFQNLLRSRTITKNLRHYNILVF